MAEAGEIHDERLANYVISQSNIDLIDEAMNAIQDRYSSDGASYREIRDYIKAHHHQEWTREDRNKLYDDLDVAADRGHLSKTWIRELKGNWPWRQYGYYGLDKMAEYPRYKKADAQGIRRSESYQNSARERRGETTRESDPGH